MTFRVAGAALVLTLAACGGDDDALLPDKNRTEAIENAQSEALVANGSSTAGSTPMQQREAVIGLLNKRNGLTRDLKMKPGQALRVGDVIVRLRACETTAPWEESQDTGAFVQLDVQSPKDQKWRRVFSGWLFKERPDRNVVQHAVYDVWVKSCTMSWPEAGPETDKVGGGSSGTGGESGGNASSASGPGPAASAADSGSSDTSDSAAPNNER